MAGQPIAGPDASALITVVNSREAGSDLAWVRSGGKGPIEPLLTSRFDEAYPAVSPDGRWLAFVSNQSGQNQVYVRSLTSAGEQEQVSLAGGTEPGWSRDGHELFIAPGRVSARSSWRPAWRWAPSST